MVCVAWVSGWYRRGGAGVSDVVVGCWRCWRSEVLGAGGAGVPWCMCLIFDGVLGSDRACCSYFRLDEVAVVVDSRVVGGGNGSVDGGRISW